MECSLSAMGSYFGAVAICVGIDCPFFGFKPPSSDGKRLQPFSCSYTDSLKWAPRAGETPILRSQSMSYTSGSHTVFYHRYHIVWITKYRYTVLEGALRERIRTIIRQVCKELGVQIVSGVLSREHVHMFVEIPPHIAVSDFVRRVKGRSSHRVQMEFPDLRKRYWGRHFWARGYFSTTSGNITDDVILQYLQEHEPTGLSR